MQAPEPAVAVDERFSRLRELLARVSDLRAAGAVLSWDQETHMPPGAVEARAHQIATVERLAHELFTSDEIGHLLDDLAPVAVEYDPESIEASLLRVVRRDFDKAHKLPGTLVAEIAEAVSHGKEAWKRAREMNDFPEFAPQLSNILDLTIRKADAYGFRDRMYDALLDDFEPGMKTETVERVFFDLRKELVPIVDAIADHPDADDRLLHQHFDQGRQWEFGLDVIRGFGYDFSRGRQDISTHPFSTSFSITDVRITTRISEDFLSAGLFGTMHEAGHALYEQGIDMGLERTPLADGSSLAMHESQSRLWENLVGRGRPFWQHYYPRLQSVFPEQLSKHPLSAFYRAVNKVKPGPIRVEADEVTYNLHIMLRFEIENELLEGKLAVDDLPEAWNARMVDYLKIRPEDNAHGVLQDIHWSLGAFGYFPTYALGNLMSTQIFEKAGRDLPDLEEKIAEGNFADLLAWLRDKIHRHGRMLPALDLLEAATGQRLNAASWLSYIRRKYGEIYKGLAGGPEAVSS